ncbi:DUF1275 family protein (plasmid) [Phyllobacterium sp. A18/5-2]|uniref:YoaK family protein n=1 Tax=Phyllobacterium sp. A18/5-2 TaxID=2978392 RepID=UPI0021C5A707|nr:DUF1275 family protein [Phyllobacterium sp. A18/5-2]UXN66676.1 DUF1275 family protein [Phyllobacterium sp. A18/5-2]
MKPKLPALLSFNGGYVDTAGFLALQGLFTAHVTGNFVTLGASLVYGTSGALAKLMALPVFCCIVVLTRLLGYCLTRYKLPVLRTMLSIKLLLLTVAAVLAISYGPFPDGDSWTALVTGMVLVSAMAIQNAVHRIHLATAPPTTLMTGTTTQIMIDFADLLHGTEADKIEGVRQRVKKMVLSVFAFACGCGLAAALYLIVQIGCFIVPPLLALVALLLREASGEQVNSSL